MLLPVMLVLFCRRTKISSRSGGGGCIDITSLRMCTLDVGVNK